MSLLLIQHNTLVTQGVEFMEFDRKGIDREHVEVKNALRGVGEQSLYDIL